ncbi:glycosyltransferase family 4 protein [Algoriphagus ratkowskyi]|uniref:glycosyltransferase family 4 protein n=1 Tax=Algoriphagus ratkowskyi TaxID=57028 RepID=UPI0013022535|nr:glycosyltransferase [Algoriphagus ratkowskyi]
MFPEKPFISGGNRPSMVSFLNTTKNVYTASVDYGFELGTLDFRVSVYRNLIQKHVTPGSILVPSDDEACLRACCQLSDKYKVIGVIHSDDQAYFDLIQKYKSHLSSIASVSKRIKNKQVQENDSIPHEVIPCGIPMENFSIGSKSENIISWVGRIEEESKRVSDIPKIGFELKKVTDDWEMNIYGDGEPLSSLKEQTSFLKLENNMFFHGWSSFETLREKLSSTKVLLQTSNFEGMSISVMEALASGCMVVSSQVSGVEDLIEDSAADDIVYLYPVGDIAYAQKQLENALSNLNSNTPFQARKLAEKHYSIKVCLQSYIDLGLRSNVKNETYPISFKSKINTLISGFISKSRYLKHNLIQK